MSLALACACGARFEVDDSYAGQEVNCPDCHEPLAVPAPPRAPARASELALAAATLALVGAFTVVGTLAAALLGLAALLQIRRHRLAGTGLALFAVLGGAGFTLLTLFALVRGEPFGLEGWARGRMLADQVDTRGPLEIAVKNFSLTRPSELWGRAREDRLTDTAVAGIQHDLDLLLAHPARYALVDVQTAEHAADLDAVLNNERDNLVPGANPLLHDPDDDDDPGPRHPFNRPPARAREIDRHALAPVDGFKGLEAVVDVRRGGEPWRFIVRVYQREGVRFGQTTTYTVRAYTPRRRFGANEAEERKLLDSFRVRK